MSRTAQRVRADEQRKRAAGLVQIKAWVPDTPEARRALQQRAAELRQQHEADEKAQAFTEPPDVSR